MPVAIRTFLAIELSAAVRWAVARQAQRVMHALSAHSDVLSWVQSDHLHVTVKFFGETPASQVAVIHRAVERVVAPWSSFDIDIRGLGVFPDRRAPRVLWAGVSGDLDALTALVERVGAAVVPLGFPREEKPFHPHLTVARITGAYRDVGRTLGVSGMLTDPVACGRVSVERVVLFKSERRSGGSFYARLWDVALEAGAGVP